MEANTNTNQYSLPDLLKVSAESFAKQTAIICPDRELNFETFDQRSDSVAAFLAAKGIRKGNRIGLYCINSDAFAIAYFGIVKAGATVVPINLLLTPKEVAYILNDAGVRGLIYHEAFYEAVPLVLKQVDEAELSICIGARETGSNHEYAWDDVIHFEGKVPDIQVEPKEDVVALIYTSGTTGYPKGAMLTHTNLISNTFSIKSALKLTPGSDRFLLVLPMFHAFAATVGMLFPLLHGCTFVPLPKFGPALVANTIEKVKATIFMGVPSMYSVLMKLSDEYIPKFSSLNYCVSGGAAMPVELMKQFEARFGKYIYEGDGPTECSPVTSVNPIGGVRKPGSVGLAVPGVEMKILDDQGEARPRGEMGELCVRGANVMKGYWNREEETKASFFGDWFRTGDLGMQDEDDYFFIVDRIKDMIIVNGMNVYPRVVEEVLYAYELVREAAVVGAPHKLHGEIPIAYIALKEGYDVTVKDVRTFCKGHLGRHQIPKNVFFMKELPKNTTGKILKRELRKAGEIERGIA
ncbi:MAG: long-chain-fatty-acid--CoA ligase [Kiritimatiellae bacterium]|nr:long-chain-fatty-acid--CoA ligase [Kiritimatiellia bacterium]